MLKSGNIVLAPLRQSLWPGKIISLDVMAEIQFFKLDLILKVPPKLLVQYTPFNVKLLTNRSEDKALTSAIKIADKEFNQRNKNETDVKKKKDHGKLGKSRVESLPTQSDNKPLKVKEAIKKQQEDEDEAKDTRSQLCMAQNLAQYLLQLNQGQLIKQVKTNIPRQVSFLNTATKEVQKYLREPKILLIKLTEQLMRQVCYAKTRSIGLPYQKRLKIIFNSWHIDPCTIVNSDICKLANMTIRQQKEKYPWITSSYIDVLQKFKENMKIILDASQNDYSEIAPLMNNKCYLLIKRSTRTQ